MRVTVRARMDSMVRPGCLLASVHDRCRCCMMMRIAKTADQRQQDHEDLVRLAVSRETKGEVTVGLASSDVADGTHENTDMKSQ